MCVNIVIRKHLGYASVQQFALKLSVDFFKFFKCILNGGFNQGPILFQLCAVTSACISGAVFTHTNCDVAFGYSNETSRKASKQLIFF